MSGIKRERAEEVYQSSASSHVVLPQQLMLNPVVTLNGEQYLEIDPIQLANYQNSQSNLLYFILPKDASNAQSIQTVYLMPSDAQQTNELNHPIVDDNIGFTSKNSGILIQNDKSTISKSHGVDVKSEILDDFARDRNPLQIREHVSYAIAKRYNEAVQEASTENVIKHNEFMWKTNIKCDRYPDCKVVLTSNYEKKIHMDDHYYPANPTFKCSICNMVFDRAVDRNKHIESHSIPNTYKCDACAKTFPYYTSYVYHLHEEECTSNKSLTCLFCGTQFAHADDVLRHNELNANTCVCGITICGSEALDLHRSLCTQYKKKINNAIKGKSLFSNDIIVLD